MNDKKIQPCWIGWAERVEKLENLLCSHYTKLPCKVNDGGAA